MNGSHSRNPSNSTALDDGRGRKPSFAPANPHMTRAERFEDEKKRMIESCFSKVDQNGQLAESYITHIRIQEDAAHPSAPAPPTSVPENKKPRVVVVAVRSTGRVRMHKARENNNGSFSIGKTWNLEDLSSIECFTHHDPNASPSKQNYYQWAGSVGFVVTISKPYYWQAATSKEKDFFIASLVKIYRKYTKGQVPDLRGFEPREVEQMTGVLPPQQQQLPRPSPAAPDRFSPQNTPPPPRPPFAEQHRPSSQESSRSRLRPSTDNEGLPPTRPPQSRPQPSQDRGLRQEPSRERMQKPSREQMRAPSRDRMPPGPNQPPAVRPPRLTPKSSRAELQHHQQPQQPHPIVSEQTATSFSSSTRTLPPAADTPPRQQPPPQLSGPPPRQQPPPHAFDPPSREQPPSQLVPARAAERQQSSQSMRSDRSLRTQPSNDSHPAEGAALLASTTNQWKPTPRERSPKRGMSPMRPQSPVRPLSPVKPPQHPTDVEERAPSPLATNGFQTLPERKRPLMAGGRGYSATPSEADADAEAEALRPPPLSTSRNVSANRPSSPQVEKPATPVGEDNMPGTFYDTPAASTSNLSDQIARPESQSSRSVQDSIRSPTQPETPVDSTDRTESPLDDPDHRPGLGPMFKRKQKPGLADAVRKATAAHSAFKPRVGGAAERMRALTGGSNKGAEPDGITGVVPAPLRKKSVDIERTQSPISPVKPDFPATTADSALRIETQVESEPLPKVSTEAEAIPNGTALAEIAGQNDKQPVHPEVMLSVPAPEPRRPKRRSAQQENHLRSLNIDPRTLDGRGLAFEGILSDFGWGAGILKGRQLEDLEADLRRELGRVEAGSWLGHLEQKDDRVDVVDQMLDRAIAECDELDGLLTIYSAELSTLNDDISFIEAQSQGLQVQTANQKILHTELHKLVDTISIAPQQLQPLRRGDLSHPESLKDVEHSLLVLYKAMVTIDPSVRSSAAGRQGNAAVVDTNDISAMDALQEKRRAYQNESQEFCQRLMRKLEPSFSSALSTAKPALLQSSGGIGNSGVKLNGPAFNLARNNLWQYSPLLLFAKETNMPLWQSLLQTYYTKARPIYTDVFRENINKWKQGARKPTDEAAELLFTSVEKETSEGLTSTARKLTVKRSQTLAKTIRHAAGVGGSSSHTDRSHQIDRQAGRMQPYDVFSGLLEEQVPLVSMEQNFMVDLFHATSMENIDFADAVLAHVPEARLGTDITAKRLMEPDRAMARLVANIMEETFGWWVTDLRALMDWAVAGDPIQGVAILTSLAIHAQRFQETSQEFLVHNLNAVSTRLQTLFQKFVDEQIHAIEDTKVKTKKRKGVIAFMKIFPLFSAAVENTYYSVAGSADGTVATSGPRQLIDDAYIRINKAMWDSLKVIARESPTAPGASATAATQGTEFEDKEILNYHILLIENMNHYIEDVDDGGKEGSVLAEWKAKALMDRAEHMEEYVDRVVRRPIGKVIDFVESTESLLKQNMSGPSIAARPSYSRSSAKKLLAAHDSKEIRRGIDTLIKRIEKHFGDADEEQLSRQLVNFVCKECERRYDGVLDRVQRVCKELYKEEEKKVEIDWTKEDNRVGFKRS